MRILITGASGSGTTTLGSKVSDQLAIPFFDADDYYWLPTDPPFRYKRSPGVRRLLLMMDLEEVSGAVVSGSVDGWGRVVEDSFSLIVFLTVPATIRLKRLRMRERELYGRAAPAFLEWAAQYDLGYMAGRSRPRHEKWLSQRDCRILRIDGDLPLEELSDPVVAAVGELSGCLTINGDMGSLGSILVQNEI